MSETSPKRAPRAFNLDAPGKPVEEPNTVSKKAKPAPAKTIKPRKPRAVKDKLVIKAIDDEAAQRLVADTADLEQVAEDLTPPPPTAAARRFKWSKVFFGALTGLLALGIGLWVDQLVRDLFVRYDWLGWLALALTGILVLAALAISIRELRGLSRMAKIDRLREDATQAIADDDAKLAKSSLNDLEELYAGRADMARGRSTLAAQNGEIIDGKDLIALAERALMTSLDTKARGIVMGSAKRVSVVTAVSPRALVDISYVLIENVRLIRRIAELYGGRPGTLGFWRLARNVVGHLAVTGSIAVGDGLIQQLVGHGVAAKISSRLGEGVVNGLLTARIGIAAIDVCRPLPFSDQSRPTIGDFMSELVNFSSKDTATGK